MKNQIIKIIFALVLSFTIFSCEDEGTNNQIKVLPTILEIAQSQPENFSILIAALKKTGLAVNVSSGGSYTVFAPVNAAFTGLYTEAGINALNPNVTADATSIGTLRRLLQNHILGSGSKADDLLAAEYVKTFASGVGTTTTLSMYINKVGNDVLVNGGTTSLVGAKVTTANLEASNGIVHVVDAVLKLPRLVDHIKINPNLKQLLAIVTTTAFGDQSAVLTKLSTASSNATYASDNTNPVITLFAPLDSAFITATATGGYLKGASFDFAADPVLAAANITKVLQYHVSQSLPFTPPLTAVVGNLTSNSNTSWTGGTATRNAVIKTLAPGNQEISIEKGTLKISELPAQTGVPVSNIKTVNIQATNGVIHTIDRVLKPVL